MSESRRKDLKEIVAKVLDDDPKNFFACRWNAAMYAAEATGPNSKALIDARESLMVALKHAPERDKTSIWRAIASIESCRGDYESAVKAFREAISLSPKHNQLRLELAAMYMRMGAKYFAVACEELDGISEDIGGRKQVALAYLHTFLDEPEKAAKAYELCDEESKPIIKAHMLLIQGKKKEAKKVVESQISGAKGYDLANWLEFYICLGGFNEAISLGEKYSEAQEYVGSNLQGLLSLARLLKRTGKDFLKEKNELLSSWNETSWDFRELLIFRECSKKTGADFVDRLEVIEDLIRRQELERVRSSGLGLFGRALGFKHGMIPRGEFRVIFE
jgi:tetratricopeptide (TPR) repeat protein